MWHCQYIIRFFIYFLFVIKINLNVNWQCHANKKKRKKKKEIIEEEERKKGERQEISHFFFYWSVLCLWII